MRPFKTVVRLAPLIGTPAVNRNLTAIVYWRRWRRTLVIIAAMAIGANTDIGSRHSLRGVLPDPGSGQTVHRASSQSTTSPLLVPPLSLQASCISTDANGNLETYRSTFRRSCYPQLQRALMLFWIRGPRLVGKSKAQCDAPRGAPLHGVARFVSVHHHTAVDVIGATGRLRP